MMPADRRVAMIALKITTVGNSTGVILPKEVLVGVVLASSVQGGSVQGRGCVWDHRQGRGC